MIMDRELHVVFLHELLNPGKDFGCRIAGDDHGNPRSFGILELTSDIVIFVFGKIDGADSVKLDVGGCVVCERLRFRGRVHRKMVLHIFRIQRQDVELLHVADQLRPA